MKIRVSLIIPTFNRPDSLIQALNSLETQTCNSFETIVVDNADNKQLAQRIKEFNRSSRICVRYIPEPCLGLHNARHAGAHGAKGDILVFTDDDATFDTGWLEAYTKAFAEYPEMVAAGGPVRPNWEAPPPKWLLKFMGDAKTFAPLSLMEPYKEFRLDPKCVFYGVNMAIRRDVLFAVGGFHPELIGGLTVGDGEAGLNRKLLERGYRIGYVPSALVYHHIPPARMTLDFLCRWQTHRAGAQMYRQYHIKMPGRLRLAVDAVQAVLSSMGTWVLARCIPSRTGRLAISLQLRAALGYARFRYILRLIYDQDFREMVTHRVWLTSPPVTQRTEP